MVLMPVYVETAEGLVKPLVILPAAIMPLFFLSLFSHDVIAPPLFLLIHLFSQPTSPRFTLKITPTLVIAFVPLSFHRLTTIGNIFYLWQNNVVKDSSWPLSYLV